MFKLHFNLLVTNFVFSFLCISRTCFFASKFIFYFLSSFYKRLFNKFSADSLSL